MLFKQNFFDEMAQAVFSHPVEICGNLRREHEFLVEESKYEGEEKDGRVLCTIHEKEKTPFLYHTHPISSKAYPSIEDIVTVVKKREAIPSYTSILFTIWGVWIMMPKKSIKVSDAQMNEWKEIFRKTTTEFYWAQRNDDPTESKSKMYSPFIQEQINQFIRIVEHLLGEYVSIRFIEWGQLEQIKDYYKLGNKSRKRSKRTKKSTKKSTRCKDWL